MKALQQAELQKRLNELRQGARKRGAIAVAAAVFASLSAAGVIFAALTLGRRKEKAKTPQDPPSAAEARPVYETEGETPGETGASRAVFANALRALLLIVFICCLLYAGTSLLRYYGASRGTESGIEQLRSGLVTAEPEPTPEALENPEPSVTAGSPEPAAEPSGRVYEVSERFGELYKRNGDLAGWVSISGTGIDYPVMLTKYDEQYYIDRNFDGESDDNGLPFLDARCEIAPKNQIQLVYGHNIKSGIMFHDLIKYESEQFWREHQYISYDTIYDEAVYQIVAAFVFDAGADEAESFQFHRFTEFTSEGVFDIYKRRVQEMSLYDTGLDFGFDDEYLILATCEYSASDGRFVLLAKLVDYPLA